MVFRKVLITIVYFITAPHYVMLLCLTLSLPSPMTTILQKISVSVHCVSTSPRFIPIAQALERGGQGEQL